MLGLLSVESRHFLSIVNLNSAQHKEHKLMCYYSGNFNKFQIHCNAAQSLCDIIRLGREQVLQLQDRAEPDPLLTAVEK